jgi:hypothetical protein
MFQLLTLSFTVIGLCFICIVIYSFGKRILRLELIAIEMAKVIDFTHFVSKTNTEHISGLIEAISQRDDIKESMNRTLN